MMLYFAICFINANLISFLAVWWDKQRAIRGSLRIPEFTLHLLSLSGGFMGAATAMKLFRHKTRKLSFITIEVLVWMLWITAIGIYWYEVLRHGPSVECF
jgi:uncharacterized membrane protein YsdA (DUF1294 family)